MVFLRGSFTLSETNKVWAGGGGRDGAYTCALHLREAPTQVTIVSISVFLLQVLPARYSLPITMFQVTLGAIFLKYRTRPSPLFYISFGLATQVVFTLAVHVHSMSQIP